MSSGQPRYPHTEASAPPYDTYQNVIPPPAYNYQQMAAHPGAPPAYYRQQVQAGPYAHHPPPYSQVASAQGFPPAQAYVAGNGSAYIPAAFDSGARFDGIARPTIPPPPPGVAPNSAQMAAMQGRPVVVEQKKSGFFGGGGGAGYTFW